MHLRSEGRRTVQTPLSFTASWFCFSLRLRRYMLFLSAGFLLSCFLMGSSGWYRFSIRQEFRLYWLLHMDLVRFVFWVCWNRGERDEERPRTERGSESVHSGLFRRKRRSAEENIGTLLSSSVHILAWRQEKKFSCRFSVRYFLNSSPTSRHIVIFP